MDFLDKFIFAVDDDEEIRKLLKVYLKKYHVEMATHGQEALDKLLSLDRLPDLILLDVEMPVMNGPELKKNLERNEKLKNIPVVYLTANNQFKIQSDSSDIHFLNKPIEKDDLLNVIDIHLQIP